MGEEQTQVETVAGIEVEVTYKTVKHLHLSVYPPLGQVKAVVPTSTKPEKVQLFLASRLGWIKRKRREMAAQPRRAPRQFTEGESVFLWGKQYRLRLVDTSGRHTVRLKGDWLELSVRPGTQRQGRRTALYRFYRNEMDKEVPRMTQTWEQRTGLKAAEYRIKLMYTKWGSCNTDAKRVWLNVELAKHDKRCLSYLLLHELLHLRERQHSTLFQSLLSQYLPGWKNIRNELNSGFPGLPELPVCSTSVS